MYKDIISYKLANSISEKRLLDIAGEIIKSWMSSQSGFIRWEICKNNDDGYTDIVSWESKEDAKKAEKEMMNIPNAANWYACYAEGSISCKNLTQIGEFR